MQRLSHRFLVALVTFAIGVVIAAVWMTRQVPRLENPIMKTSRCFPGVGQKNEKLKAAEGSYFPESAFYQDDKRNKFVSNWYTRSLSEVNEPSLLIPSNDQNASYRFLWLRSFHPTVVVRVWSDGEKRMLSVKEFKVQKQNQSRQLLVDHTRALMDEEWAAIAKLVDESCFWAEPTSTNDPVAMDGAWWVLEGADKGYYHVTTRQSPDGGPYRELCLYLLKLSGLPLDATRDEIY